MRRIFTTLGAQMHTAGVLDDPRDIFHLTVDEAFGWVRGTTVTTNLRGLAALRMEEYAGWAQAAAPADRFRTWGPVWDKNAFLPTVAPKPPGEGLSGLPACPGVVEATVRRIEDPRGEPPLQGEVLVAYRTDPGWVPLFPNAVAILVERGSLLSHSAVVAREMGIPTVVGIAGLMDALRSGDRVRVDAGAGTVEILARVGT
jgi:pyruvate,water dikinase